MSDKAAQVFTQEAIEAWGRFQQIWQAWRNYALPESQRIAPEKSKEVERFSEGFSSPSVSLVSSPKEPPLPSVALLSTIPPTVTALQRAHQIGVLVAAVGFDWSGWSQVWEKVKEEMAEVLEAIEAKNRPQVAAELGDLLFSLAQIGRHLGVESEAALHQSCDTFSKRFRYIEETLAKSGLDLQGTPLDLLEKLWKEAKRHFAQEEAKKEADSACVGTPKELQCNRSSFQKNS